jgi:hypothetical protein
MSKKRPVPKADIRRISTVNADPYLGFILERYCEEALSLAQPNDPHGQCCSIVMNTKHNLELRIRH